MENWLKESGAIGLDNLEVADFPITGRGVRTGVRFSEGEKILTIPSSTLWTVKRAQDDLLFGPVLRSLQKSWSVEDTLAIYILFVRSQDSGYEERRSHVAALPASYSSSIFFTNDELKVCAGSSLHTLTAQLKQQIEDNYKRLILPVLAQHRDLLPLHKFTIKDYKWALCTIWSRSMDFTVSEGNVFRLLAPFADMLNHSYEAKQCHTYDPHTGNLSVLAGKDYEAGDQVFINYGPVPNNRLLRLYGFVLPDNPNDRYDLVLETSPMAPLYEQKQGLWSLAGLDSTHTVPLTLTDPLPKDVLRYLRIQRLEESDITAMTFQLVGAKDEKLNDSNELQILQFLIESINAILDGFGIPLEKLEAQVADGVYPLGGNAWAAAQVSLGEQRVLRLTKKAVEGLLAAVENGKGSVSIQEQCAKCGKDSTPLMLCSRCKSVKYCGRTCQVDHYREHKAICRAMVARNSAKTG